MTVRIVTDSTSDLTQEITNELGITVVPLYVRFGDEVYIDGVDLTTDEFYRKLSRDKILPSTAAPAAAAFTQVFDELTKGTDEVVAIILSSKYSATYDAAVLGREISQDASRITVIDSQAAVSKLGLVVITAAKAAQTGASRDIIVRATHDAMNRVDMRMAFDTLEYLARGGRVGTAQAFLGSMLKVNPIITIKNGYTEAVTRTRSRGKAIDNMVEFAMSFSRIDELAVEDATTPEEADLLVERLSTIYPRDRIYRTKVSPVVGTHVGPHVLVVSVLGKRDEL